MNADAQNILLYGICKDSNLKHPIDYLYLKHFEELANVKDNDLLTKILQKQSLQTLCEVNITV